MTSISIFVPTFEYAGGAERYVINLSKGLVERGHSVEIVTGEPNGPFSHLIPEEVSIYKLSAPKIPFIGVMSTIIPLMRYFKRQKPRNFLSVMNHSNIPALLAYKLSQSDSNLIITEHNNPNLLLSDKNPYKRRDQIIYRLAEHLYPYADSIVGVSYGVADDLAEVISIRRDDITVIYNPVVSSELEIGLNQKPDHWMFMDNTPVIIGAKPEAQKNIPLLVRAFAELRKTHDAHLIIVGNGEQKEIVSELASNLGISQEVDVIGYVDDIYPYLSCADIFASSSNWEGLPTIHIEALACRTPVVATDCPSGPSEILNDGEYGELVPTGDVRELSDALKRTLESPPDRKKLSKRARDFSIENSVVEYEKILR